MRAILSANVLAPQTLVPNAGDTANNVCKDGVMPGVVPLGVQASNIQVSLGAASAELLQWSWLGVHAPSPPAFCPGLFSIEILAMCPGGAWRTLDEWKELFGKQGFKLEDVKEIGASMHLMVWGR